MKIQEMRSGILHLNKKVENERRENVFEMRPIGETFDAGPVPVCKSELDEPLWSVVSFKQREAGGLTYKKAVAVMADLDSHKVPGLCIVTDEAALRMRP